jgi:hypothetical protein
VNRGRGISLRSAFFAAVLALAFSAERIDDLTRAHITLTSLWGTAAERTVSAVRHVVIDPLDYDRWFGSRRPLNAATFERLLRALARAQPRAIGVDIESSSLAPEIAQSVPGIVWARTGRYSNSRNAVVMEPLFGRFDASPLQWGLALITEIGGVLRGYQHSYRTTTGTYPSFPIAVAMAAHVHIPTAVDPTLRLINFRTVAARGTPMTTDAVFSIENDPSWAGSLSSSIVLVSSAYTAPDESDTPVGWLTGPDITGDVIDTELDGGGVPYPGALRLFLLQFGSLIVLWLPLTRMTGLARSGMYLSLAALLACGCALIAYHRVAYATVFGITFCGLIPLKLLYSTLLESAKGTNPPTTS